MQNFGNLDDLAKKLSALLPEPVRNMQEDVEKNMRGLLEGGLQKMNLVTREEFDIQSAVLLRTREKLEALEKRLAELEAQQTTPTPTNRTVSGTAHPVPATPDDSPVR
jgi:BMFP domain-containing protein YqiC